MIFLWLTFNIIYVIINLHWLISGHKVHHSSVLTIRHLRILYKFTIHTRRCLLRPVSVVLVIWSGWINWRAVEELVLHWWVLEILIVLVLRPIHYIPCVRAVWIRWVEYGHCYPITNCLFLNIFCLHVLRRHIHVLLNCLNYWLFLHLILVDTKHVQNVILG